MSWARYGDEFWHDCRWDGVPYEARFHYVQIVAACSKSQRYDCRIPTRLALRASDVPDPDAAIAALVASGWLVIDGDHVQVVDGEKNHMPPPALREQKRKADQRRWTREYRRRKCEEGNHSQDCPRDCPRRAA